ncbi:alpha/beta hydrolase family protein [Bacillus solitudinis]|uniref:alpha/beta hydrolase family protein n=1 Tax=Bacillus solitudinis TaxID=2014074 RepID=UPI000C241AB4|nr:prolyl oligopeptidase family serine peptidase [Bacillus solitudinis]
MTTKLISSIRIPSPHPRIYLYEITYGSDGFRVKGYLAVPQIIQQRLPGLLYLRGGIKNVGMVRVQRLVQWASQGFVVMAPFYRGNRGGEGQEDFCGEDRMDAIAAFDLLSDHEKVNPHQVHVLGFSRGGVMALLTAQARNVTSVTSWNGVTDMVLTYEERVELRRMMKRVIGGTPNKYPERYAWRTPLKQLKKLQAPVLLIHGCLDQHVSIEHAYRLEQGLLLLNKPVEAWYYPIFTHHFPMKEQQRILIEAANWMKQHDLSNVTTRGYQ